MSITFSLHGVLHFIASKMYFSLQPCKKTFDKKLQTKIFTETKEKAYHGRNYFHVPKHLKKWSSKELVIN